MGGDAQKERKLTMQLKKKIRQTDKEQLGVKKEKKNTDSYSAKKMIIRKSPVENMCNPNKTEVTKGSRWEASWHHGLRRQSRVHVPAWFTGLGKSDNEL